MRVGTNPYLRGHELGGTAEGAGRLPIPHLFFTQTVIGNLHVSVQCEQDIVELEIAGRAVSLTVTES